MATQASPELWPLLEPAATLALGVLVRSEPAVRRIVALLDRDGLLVKLAFCGLAADSLHPCNNPADVVIVEVGPGGQDADDVIRRTRSELKDAGIVVICPSSARRELPRLLEAGADGIVVANELDAALAAAVRSAAAGQVSVPRSMRHLVSPPALTHREKEIVSLVIQGLTNGQIAARLFLAESTVKTHLSSAFRRLGVKSRREAAALVLSADDDLRQRLAPAAVLESHDPTVHLACPAA
jgi:DNA-binding NarL/FixJ family response regulator